MGAFCCASQRREEPVIIDHFAPKQASFCCSKVVVIAGAITALMIAILGVLALLGLFYPGNSLSNLGNFLGYEGAYVALGAGLTLFVAIILGKCIQYYCSRKDMGGEISHLPRTEDPVFS